LETQNRSFKTEVSSLNRRLDESEGARDELEAQNRTFKNEISSLKNDLRTALSQNTTLQQSLDEAADYNISMEEKVYKSNKISLDLLKEVKEMEVHINGLEGHIRNLEFQLGFYNPVKGDAIDIKLAEFINNAPERPALKSLFVRE
jgi:chromosome segregation ATPase